MNKDENIALMVVLIKSTAKYVHRRIESSKQKEAYIEGINDAIKIINRSASLDEIKVTLVSQRKMWKRITKGNNFYKDKHHCYPMALDHSLDVVESIQRRFMTDPTERTVSFINALDVILKEDDALFGDMYEN